ncbi:hypothetical protein FHS26_000269 [Rhizobium pisi]|uniref:Uncharacterized protein n=1 Tax=Rhizobium pisi TaxID=574561 RepID=A0A3R9B0M5_9HYPH|nr:hypothetical protein [Rhizobium pisi]MBB3132574.1 hypothetical protein [Rhizobium pisi]RSB86572.1 hypothetical protein EFD55_01240 [Rhizobium pisi]TCA62969.1 hypothetical protein E0J16_01455 [Rhizobium pisi]
MFPALFALACHFVVVFQEFYKPGPKSWETSLLCVPIFAYIWANIFSVLVDQTPVSMLSASLATALPCACLAIYFFYSRQIKRKPDPQISTAKALGVALSGLALVALAAYGMAQITACTNAKCRGGTELFGHFRFAAFYLISLWGGWIIMCSIPTLHEVLRRFFKRVIK